jgi:hypothetical protein
MRTAFAFQKFSLILAAVLFLLPSPARALPNVSEGKWEMKGDVKYQGEITVGGKLIHLKPTPVHYSQCITKKDLVPSKKEKNENCTKVSEKASGNTVTWVLKCNEPNGMKIESSGSITYSSTASDAIIHSVLTDAQGGKIKATETIKGRRVGPCK